VTSALGCLLALLGLVLGVTQLDKSKPFRWSNAVRYQGWLRWHYISGVFFGVFALTWVFSGLLSMEPFDWANEPDSLELPADALSGGPVELREFPPFAAAAWATLLDGGALKELELLRILDAPFYLARFTGAAEALIDARSLTLRTEPFAAETLVARLRAAAPGVDVAAQEMLTDYDSYYYARNRQAALPVLRVKLADPHETWVYVDPALGQLVASLHRLQRLERWLYHGLHSLDFGFWYDRRPLWDIGMILLSLGALVTTTIGMWLGFKRLKRGLA